MLLQTKKTWTICISTDEVLAYPDKEIMQTPTPYEQREHQLCFFFIQLNRQVSSVRKKSQCAFYVVICLLTPGANETKVILFLKKTKSASPFCLYTSRHLCSLWHFARQHSRHTAPRRVSRNTDNSTCKRTTRLFYAGPRIGCGVTRLVIPRHDAESRNTRVREYSLCVPFSSKRLPLSGPRIRCGVT